MVVRARADLRTLPLTADKGAMLGEPVKYVRLLPLNRGVLVAI